MHRSELSPRIKHDMDIARKYNSQRKPAKHLAEMQLLNQAFAFIKPGAAVLDAPCGTGRATLLLHQLGYQAHGVDLGTAAITVARENALNAQAAIGFDLANVMELPYGNKSFEASLCFRFYHHLGDDVMRNMLIQELCRVSEKQVLISYFTPYSFTSIKRRIVSCFSKPSVQHATSLSSIEAIFSNYGFKLVTNLERQPFFHTLNLAIFERA